jgi:hypothetical protein
MKSVAALAALAVFACSLLGATATAASSSRLYVDVVFVGNGIESQGIYFQGRKVPVDNAFCIGLRRYGVQSRAYNLDRYWRFRCTADAANGHAYDVQLSTVTGARRGQVYPHYISVKELY